MALINSLTDYKTYSTTAGLSDALLTLFLDEATNIVEDYLGYSPETASYTTTLSGNGSYIIQLKAKPISAITSITIDGVSQTTNLFTTKDELLIKIDGTNVFTKGFSNVVVAYTAGYSITATINIPQVIIQTIYKIADILKNDRQANGQVSISSPDGGTRTLPSYQNFDKQLSPLEKYRIVEII